MIKTKKDYMYLIKGIAKTKNKSVWTLTKEITNMPFDATQMHKLKLRELKTIWQTIEIKYPEDIEKFYEEDFWR